MKFEEIFSYILPLTENMIINIATMNMFYSDFDEVMKKADVSNLKTYSAMSVAFIKDKDAASEKVLRYALFIPKD